MQAQSNNRLVLQPHMLFTNPTLIGISYAKGGFYLRSGWDADVAPGLRSGRKIGQSHRWKGCRYI